MRFRGTLRRKTQRVVEMVSQGVVMIVAFLKVNLVEILAWPLLCCPEFKKCAVYNLLFKD